MIEYRETADGLTPKSLQGFFHGWPNPPSPETHLALLRGSAHVVLAVEEDRVIGFVTAISDGVLSAHVTFLEVLAEHREQGIGSELMRRIVARLQSLYAVDLVCDPALAPFYERLGFRPGHAMLRRDLSRQAGAPR